MSREEVEQIMRLERIITIAACFVLALVAVTTAGSALTISSDNLVSVPPGGISNFAYTVTGTGFMPGAQVMVRSPAGTYYSTYGETTIGTTSIRCTLSIPSVAAAGPYSVYVLNPGVAAVSRANMFTKISTMPGISSVAPVTVPRAGATITIYGTNFAPGVQVRLTIAGVTISPVETRLSSTAIRVAVPSTWPAGIYSVCVQNPGMTSWVCRPNAFTKSAA